jgi:hypothetical protein
MSLLLDKDSIEPPNSLISLFSVPPTQTNIDNSYWHVAHPVSTLTSDGPYQFNIAAGPEYLHLAKNYLYIKLKIVQPTGANITATHSVAPINLLGQTLFKQVKVGVNGKLCFDSGPMYAYRAFLETELNYDNHTKNEVLATAGYVKDEKEDATCPGFIARKEQYTESKEVELMSPVLCDLFKSERLMLSNTQIQLELHRNSDAFCLLSYEAAAPSFKIVITDMIWYVKKMNLTPSVHVGIEATLMRNAAKYPLRRVHMTKIQIGAGRQSTPATPVYNGQIPRRIVVGFVETSNYFGQYKKSPFTFANNNVVEIYVEAGGLRVPREPLKMDFAKGFFARSYLQLLDTLGLGLEDRSNGITLKDYAANKCLFAFDLTPNESEDENWELVKEGATTIYCTFGEAIKEPGLEMIVYGEFDNLAMIDRNRSIYFDYTV